MIYQLDNDHIDLGKVEFISNIKEEYTYNITISADKIYSGRYYFDFQINGLSYSCDMIEDKENMKVHRENFLNAWKQYQKRKAMGYQS